MTFLYSWPLWLTILIGVGLAAVCVAGWLRSRATWTWVWRGLMAGCVVLLGLTPATMMDQPEEAVGADVFFVVDLTGSMAALDYNGEAPRLDGVRHDMEATLAGIPGARYSIIAYSSEASIQLPLTRDANAVASWAETAQQEFSFYSQGSAINRPIELLQAELARAKEANPQNARIVIFMSDGENTRAGDLDPNEKAQFDGVADLVDAGVVLGYGTEDGARMHVRESWSDSVTQEDFIIDPDTGEPAISKIDEENLRSIADQIGVPYEHRTSPTDIAALGEISVTEIVSDGRGRAEWLVPVLWPLGIALLVLGAWEAVTLAPTLRRLI